MNDSQLPQEDRGAAVLAHLSGYAGYVIPCGGVLVPIILLFTMKSARVVAIAKQALLLNVLGFFSVLCVFLVSSFGSLLLSKSPAAMFVVMIIGGALGLAVLALILLCPLIGAVKASQGEYFQYPLFGISPG